MEMTQPLYCVREMISFDTPPNCWCEGHRARELQRVQEFELATGHRK